MEILYTPKKAAELLCVSEMTLRKWRWEGKGPRFIKLGRKVVYQENHISEYVQSMTRTSTSDNGEVLPCNK